MRMYLNDLTDLLGLNPMTGIDPFAAGVLTLGFIYSAYFAETFRGAFMAVPHGQLEAATACGMRELQVFPARPVFPDDAPRPARHRQQLAGPAEIHRPGIPDGWRLPALVKIAQDAGNVAFRVFLLI